MVANFGAELAAEHNASLILQQVIRQERADILDDRTIHQIEAELAITFFRFEMTTKWGYYAI